MPFRRGTAPWLWIAAAGLVSRCGNGADPAAPTASGHVPATSVPVRSSAAPIPACSLLTTEEVGAIFGRKVGTAGSGSSCEYSLAPDRANPRDQLLVNLEVSREPLSETDVKARYAGLGKDVRRAVHPEQRGLPDTIAVGDDVPDVGDWAFAVNVASVNLGMGFSSRGRVLETQKGPVHLTVGATVAPDPGTRILDASLAAVAKTAFARMSQGTGTKN